MARRHGIETVLVAINILWLLGTLSPVAGGKEREFPFHMPSVVPQHADSYLCTGLRLDPTEEYYITGFTPNSTQKIAHHIIIRGCLLPGTFDEIWSCGGMNLKDEGTESAAPCGGDTEEILYAWAKDAPPLILPDEVAFKVGGMTRIQYLVLQVHYASAEPFKGGELKDNSGVILQYTKTPQPKAAGVITLITDGQIMPHSIEYMEVACSIKENIVIHPFAFRTHTHQLGRVVSGYKIENTDHGPVWTLIGKKDPQLPQMFYPVGHDMVISKGDMIAARCTMESNRNTVTQVGSVSGDEMCNFYIMYWTYSHYPMEVNTCFSPGPPNYYWDMDFMAVPRDASVIPVEPN